MVKVTHLDNPLVIRIQCRETVRQINLITKELCFTAGNREGGREERRERERERRERERERDPISHSPKVVGVECGSGQSFE